MVAHLGYFDIYRVANYRAVAAAVASVGNQLPVPDPVIMSTIRPLTEDGNRGSREKQFRESVSHITHDSGRFKGRRALT